MNRAAFASVALGKFAAPSGIHHRGISHHARAVKVLLCLRLLP